MVTTQNRKGLMLTDQPLVCQGPLAKAASSAQCPQIARHNLYEQAASNVAKPLLKCQAYW